MELPCVHFFEVVAQDGSAMRFAGQAMRKAAAASKQYLALTSDALVLADALAATINTP